MKNEVNKSIPVRMHSSESDKTGIMSDAGEIPGGCTSVENNSPGKTLNKSLY